MAKLTKNHEPKTNDRSITSRREDFSQWYLDIIEAAQLAEHSPVKGSMVIKPYGYAIWENIQQTLDRMFKDTGVENAYFPLFIPESFLKREAEHVAGFAPEVAVVTHAGGKKLDEPLIVRPTSETIIYDVFSRWIQSYRDLPLLINQWCNVVRWEMRPRLFLRTTEFLWQEGHTVHATQAEAEGRVKQMIEVYRDFVEDYLAMPVIVGFKSESEKFAGAVYTLCIESMMQDAKALQAGTSHMLGQNFAKAFNVKFLNKEGQEEFGWQTSWGVSTRLIGGLIMAHSDDKGLVVPPKIAPIQAVIIPIWASEQEKISVFNAASNLVADLEAANVKVKLDDREGRPGPKFFEWEKKGVPIRVEIGPKDVAQNSVVMVRRDTRDKQTVKMAGLGARVAGELEAIQKNLYQRAFDFRTKNTREIDDWDEFKIILKDKGGFIMAHWCSSAECEAKVKTETKATIRCLPFGQPAKGWSASGGKKGQCVVCGKKSSSRVLFAKAY